MPGSLIEQKFKWGDYLDQTIEQNEGNVIGSTIPWESVYSRKELLTKATIDSGIDLNFLTTALKQNVEAGQDLAAICLTSALHSQGLYKITAPQRPSSRQHDIVIIYQMKGREIHNVGSLHLLRAEAIQQKDNTGFDQANFSKLAQVLEQSAILTPDQAKFFRVLMTQMGLMK